MNITLTRDEITHLAEFHSNNGHTAQAEYFMGLLEAPTSAVQCVEAPKIIHRPDFHCPTCNLGYFGPHWEQVAGKMTHVGRACKGTPSGYDRSYFRCKANYVDYFAEFQSAERADKT